MNNVLESFLNKNSDRAHEWQGVIEGMLNDDEGAFNYASDTLRGILEYVEESGTITDAQIQAIENIRDNPTERYGRR